VTTLGPNFFEPANSAFWGSIKKVRPDLHKAFNPWDRINDPVSLGRLLNGGGVESPTIIAENRSHRINSAEDWWTILLGSGYRGTIEQLSRSERERVKEANLAFINAERISSIETNVLYARAAKSRTVK
jgi:hypothetical protein